MSFTTLVEAQAGAGDGSASLAQTAYLGLRERLVLLDIAPGAPLNEQALAAEMGVGRTPLREAIKRLEAEHFVVTYPRRGTFATRVDSTALSEISEVRRALEPVAARRAARLVDASSRPSLTAIREEIQAPSASTSPREHMMLDMRTHLAIYHAARNEHLESSLTHYLFLAMRIWCLALPRMGKVSGHIIEHTEILDAVMAGDENAAADLMLAHLDSFEEALRRVL